MRRKKQMLQFLKNNHVMINSLMCEAERKTFDGDVAIILEREIEKQMKEEGNAVH